MNEQVVKRLAVLLSVKSLVTLALTAVFAALTLRGGVSQEFMLVYTTVIAFYFGTQTQKISDAVERISEVNDAEVVVSEKRVLVAVEFEDQYNAGLDERMKQTIIETVQKVDDSLTDIEVTDDDTLYGQVKGLAERVGKATGLDELADDFGDLWDRIIGR